MQGTLVTANDYQNQDLFWALRGGGGGTFGVVTSVTLRAHPNPWITTASLDIVRPSADESFWKLVEILYQNLPRLNDLGASGLHVTYPNTVMPNTVDGNPGTFRAIMTLQFFLVDRQPQEFTAALASLSEAFQQASTHGTHSSPENFDFNITSFERLTDFYQKVLVGFDHGGAATAVGSRLVSKAFIESPDGPSRIADTFSKIKLSPNEAISGNIVAGGAVTRNAFIISSAINPAWRRTLSHVSIVRGWPANASEYEKERTQLELTNVQVPLLKELKLPDEEMGSYMNEADGHEVDFETSFWGEYYKTLSEMKRRWDAEDLFIVRKGVGSERWDNDGLCRV